MGLERIRKSNFLNKLYELISNKDYINDIHWSQDGNSFIIQNFQNFCYNIMPKVFGLKLFSSFHHQLNCYGFVKIKEQEYYNKNFTKNNRKLLFNIKRKKKRNKNISDEFNSDNDNNILKKIEFQIKNEKNKYKQLENSLFLIQKRREYLINENKFLKNKLYESQIKQQDLCYIFFSMVENLFPEFSYIKNQCLFFINSNSSVFNFQNNSLKNISENILKKYNSNIIDSGLSLTNTQDTKAKEDFDNFMDVE